jgi:ubiquinone/menaquinone biosynthesis C-methylase UbiE
MLKERVKETDEGITGDATVEMFSTFQRGMRDRGWIETDQIISAGIKRGHALEIGPGPGFLGLEWLKKTEQTTLTAVDISKDMISMSQKNMEEYGFSRSRITHIHHTALTLPFKDNTFDGIFTNGSLHEWENPVDVFNEIYRVLKPGCKFFISDLKRDLNPFVKWFLKATVKPRELQYGLITSINAAYTENELKEILGQSRIDNYGIKTNSFGLEIIGIKQDSPHE